VVVDRETVPVALGDCQLTFGGSLRVPGTVRYLHPEHNFAVVGYDPALLGETPIRSAALDDSELEVGDDTWLVGLSSQHQIVAKKTEVERLQPLALAVPSPPRFRDMNLRVLRLADSTPTVGGVLANRRGHVQALWASYSYSASDGPHSFFAGIPIQRVMEGIAPLLRDGEPHWHTLGIELQAMPLADARERGLSSEDAARIEDAAGEDRRVLSVVRVAAAGASDGLIAPGDILLDVNGAPAVEFHQLEAAAQLGRVKLRLLSGESIREVEIDGQVQSGLGTRRAIVWAGALLQDSPNDLALQRGIEPFGVYVAWFWFGSPAQRYGLRATQRIVEVDGQPTPNLDALLLAVRAKTDEGALRLKLVGLDGRPEVITLKLDLAYWPTVELERAGDRWTVTRREPGSKGETMGSAR
jgi:S1-C subfamily serine protease